MTKKQIVLMVLIVSMAGVTGGCVVAAAGLGAGTVAYVRGDLETMEPKSLDEVYKAAEKAVKELGLNVSQKTKDAMSAVFVGRDAEDKKIRIKLTAAEDNMTKLSIRIGLFGNETKSRLIHEHIKKHF